MTESVIVAIITLVGVLVANNSAKKLLEYRMDELKRDMADLTARVTKHNNLVERMAVAEQRLDTLEKR